MSFKIRDLLRIIKEAQQRERNLEVLNNRISGYVNEEGRVIYEPARCQCEFNQAQEDYDRWVNSDLDVLFGGEPTEYENCKTDDATHATNVHIMELLREYLDKNPTLRFGQALVNLDIVSYRRFNGELDTIEGKLHVLDPFYDKPDHTLEKMKRRLEEYEENKRIF